MPKRLVIDMLTSSRPLVATARLGGGTIRSSLFAAVDDALRRGFTSAELERLIRRTAN